MVDDLSITGLGAAYAERIRTAWQKSVEAIFETGRLILEAKAELPHGGFTEMIESQLPFGTSTAQRLMAIARDERLAKPAHAQLLPPSWMTLYELTKLDDATLERQFADGTITPELERGDVVAIAAGEAQLPGGARAIAPNRVEPGDSLDYFPTPPWATRALIEDVLQGELGLSLRALDVEDPACGEGHITGVAAEYARDVAGFDIFDYSLDGRSAPGWRGTRDYMAAGGESFPDFVICNPPFEDLALAFVERARREARLGVAMFFRSQWAVEGIERYERLFRDYPPTLEAYFAERVNLCKGRWEPFGSTLTAYCWLVWMNDATPRRPTFRIPPGRRIACWRADDVERFTARPVLGLGLPLTSSLSPAGRGGDETSVSGQVAEPAPDAGAVATAAPAGGEASGSVSPPKPLTSDAINQLIRDGYAAPVVDFEALGAATGLTYPAIKKRASRLQLGDRDRQREAARRFALRQHAEAGHA